MQAVNDAQVFIKPVNFSRVAVAERVYKQAVYDCRVIGVERKRLMVSIWNEGNVCFNLSNKIRTLAYWKVGLICA